MSSSISGTTSSAATATPTTATSTTAAAPASSLVTSQGIGSGLNIPAIVSALTTAFGAGQQNSINAQSSSLDAQVSAFGSFTSSLDSLQATLSAIDNPTTLAGFDGTVADPTIASATASSTAVAGTYTLAVQNLATSATLTSAAVANTTAPIGTGTLKISVGGQSTDVTIDSTDNTLAGIAAAINSSPDNPGVSASIITATNGSQLVLTGSATGAKNGITVTQSGGDGGLSALVYDPLDSAVKSTLTQTQAAQDANFTINGLAATSASNVASGVLSGVTITLIAPSAVATAATPTTPAVYTPTTLTISPDVKTATTSINAFVTALNSTLTSIQSLIAYDPSTQTAGALQGNATIEAFSAQLSTILDTVNASNTGINSLASLGLTANAQTGTYDTSASKLTQALTSSLSGVETLLGGKNGIATQVNKLLTQYTGPGGLLSSINQGLTTGLKNVSTQQTALNAELASYSATLTTQYNAMDTAVAALKQTQTYLTAEFAASAGTGNTTSSSNTSLSSGTTTG